MFRVTLVGLAPNSPYTVTVYARNGVSKVSNTEWDSYQTVQFTTDASGEFFNLRIRIWRAYSLSSAIRLCKSR